MWLLKLFNSWALTPLAAIHPCWGQRCADPADSLIAPLTADTSTTEAVCQEGKLTYQTHSCLFPPWTQTCTWACTKAETIAVFGHTFQTTDDTNPFLIEFVFDVLPLWCPGKNDSRGMPTELVRGRTPAAAERANPVGNLKTTLRFFKRILRIKQEGTCIGFDVF